MASDDLPGLLRAADLLANSQTRIISEKYQDSLRNSEKPDKQRKWVTPTLLTFRQVTLGSFGMSFHLIYLKVFVIYAALKTVSLWVANLYANVFTEEHEAAAYGPERRNTDDRRIETEALFQANEVSDNDHRSDSRRLSDVSTFKTAP